MATIAKLELPEKTFNAVRSRAQLRGRSIEDEVRDLLDHAILRDANEERLMAIARDIRSRFRGPAFTDAEFRAAEAEGRE